MSASYKIQSLFYHSIPHLLFPVFFSTLFLLMSISHICSCFLSCFICLAQLTCIFLLSFLVSAHRIADAPLEVFYAVLYSRKINSFLNYGLLMANQFLLFYSMYWGLYKHSSYVHSFLDFYSHLFLCLLYSLYLCFIHYSAIHHSCSSFTYSRYFFIIH